MIRNEKSEYERAIKEMKETMQGYRSLWIDEKSQYIYGYTNAGVKHKMYPTSWLKAGIKPRSQIDKQITNWGYIKGTAYALRMALKSKPKRGK